MLSYRHAFHAGNHADVLKHSVLVLIAEYLRQKDKPFWYIDTHAGAGRYALDSAEAKKNAEFSGGIAKLLEHRHRMPDFLHPYFAAIGKLRSEAPLSYPGSPWFAAQLLRNADRLRLFEMHPRDVELLTQTFEHDRRVTVAGSDGFDGLKALLPPPPRRALVLIDPPYELKDDYTRVVTALKDSLRRFATGIYAIWYPLLPRPESTRLPQQLAALNVPSLRIELRIDKAKEGFGMHGSGMFVINPPWLLQDQMKIVLPLLRDILGKEGCSGFLLEAFSN